MSASTPNPDLRNLKNFAQNLRQTNLGVNFAKKLFTQPNSINIKDALAIMKTLGLELPPEMNWTVDALQVYVSGQAVYTGYQNISTAREGVQAAAAGTKAAVDSQQALNSSVNATGAAVHALTSFAQSQDLVDSDTASIVHIGTDIAMIIASFGTNVAAWVDLALQIGSIGPTKQALADYHAATNAANAYKGVVGPQSAAFQKNFLKYSNKEISIYELIVGAALDAPHIFPQLIKPGSPLLQAFPELQLMPVVSGYFTGYGDSSISGSVPLNGDYIIASWHAEVNIPYVTLKDAGKTEVLAEYLFAALCKPWAVNYMIAGAEAKKRGNMAMNNIAVLSYLYAGETATISANEDYVKYLLASYLTPYDFNDYILENLASDYVNSKYNFNRPTYFEQAISKGNSTSLTDFDNYNKSVTDMAQRIQKVKNTSKIEHLVEIGPIYDKLKTYMDFEETAFEKNPALFLKASRYNTDVNKIKAWREIGNYFATLNMIEQFRKDPRLQKTRFASELEFLFGTYDQFGNDFRRIQMLSYGRAVNYMAELNIASFVGVDKKDMVKVTPDTFQGPAQFTKK